MRSFILSQCRDLRPGVMCKDFGVLVTARARVLDILEQATGNSLWEFPGNLGIPREFPGNVMYSIPSGNSHKFLKFWRELRGNL